MYSTVLIQAASADDVRKAYRKLADAQAGTKVGAVLIMQASRLCGRLLSTTWIAF